MLMPWSIRSFAIFRHKPLTLSKTPLLPNPDDLYSYEKASLLSGFMHLVKTYSVLDEGFVNSWNEAQTSSDSTITYSNLQSRLNTLNTAHQFPEEGSGSTQSLTDIQKADILVTQQWLRLVIWQSSMRQGLLSSSSPDPSMTFRYPLQIAHSLLQVISSLPTTSIEVHGLGIFEKIFEIGCSMIDVVQASGLPLDALSTPSTGRIAQDPFGAFVQTLSRTPNSQKTYATLLMAKAAQNPEIQRFDMQLQMPLAGSAIEEQFFENGAPVVVPTAERRPRGSVTELTEEELAALQDEGGWLRSEVWQNNVNDW